MQGLKPIQGLIAKGIRDKNRTAQAARQIFFSFGLKGGSILVSLLYVPIMLNYLSQEKYGVWIALTSVVNWLRLFDVGIGNGLRHQLATAISTDKMDKARELVSTTYVLLGGIFLGVLLLALVINPFINWNAALNTDSMAASELYSITNIVITCIILGLIVKTVDFVYAAHGNSAAGNVFQLVSSGISLILVWLATKYATPGNLLLLAVIVTSTPVIVSLVASIYTFRKKYPLLEPSFSAVNFKQSGSLVKLSGQFFVVQITATIMFASIPFIVTQFFGPKAVTEFHIASSIFNLPIMAITLTTAPMIPLVTQAYARNEYNWIKTMLKRANMFSVAVATGTVGLILLAPYVYQLWVGDKVQVATSLSIAVGIYAIIKVLVAPFSTFLNGIGKIKILVVLAPVGVGMFLGGCFLFSWWLNDVIAISIALSVSSVLGLFVLPPVVAKALKQ